MPETTLPAAAPPRRRIRRLWIPALFILIPVVIRGLLYAAEEGHLGEGAIFNLMMVYQTAIMLALLGVGFWFFFLSGIRPRYRLAAAAVLALIGIGFYATVERVEFDGQMTPKPYFKWEQKPEDRLAAHRSSAVKATVAADLTVGPTDSPAFRGPTGDGVVRGVRLDPNWDTNPPKILWKQPCGGGHSGFAVAGNSAVTIEQIGDDEVIVCYDRATGQERWSYPYPAKFNQTEPMGGVGPRATPAIADGEVYSLGGTGELVCLNGSNGKQKWRVNIIEDAEAEAPEWGVTASPLVVGSKVLVNPGARKAALTNQNAVMYFNRSTGKRAGAGIGNIATYASPLIADLAGTKQAIIFDAGGLNGYAADNLRKLWAIPWKTPMDMNSAQPLVVGPNRVLVSSEKGNGAAVYEIVETSGQLQVNQVWKTQKYAARYACPVLHNGHIYGLTDGRLLCLDAATGDLKWKEGSFGNGQILLAGDLLVITSERGKVHLVAADPADFRELGSIEVFKDRSWNMPALAGNHLYLRNHREMACLELPVGK